MENLIATIVVAIIAALPGIYAVIAQRRKDAASAADTLTDAALQLIEPLKRQAADQAAELVSLRAQVRTQGKEIEYLYRVMDDVVDGARRLERQVHESGGTPVYRVPPIRKWDEAQSKP